MCRQLVLQGFILLNVISYNVSLLSVLFLSSTSFIITEENHMENILLELAAHVDTSSKNVEKKWEVEVHNFEVSKVTNPENDIQPVL